MCKHGDMSHLIPMQQRVIETKVREPKTPNHSFTHRERQPQNPRVRLSLVQKVVKKKKKRKEKCMTTRVKVSNSIAVVCCVFKCRACILCTCSFACTLSLLSLSILSFSLYRNTPFSFNPIHTPTFSLSKIQVNSPLPFADFSLFFFLFFSSLLIYIADVSVCVVVAEISAERESNHSKVGFFLVHVNDPLI